MTGREQKETPAPGDFICCFCGDLIAEAKPDPLGLDVTTANGKWQAWFCHAECFRSRLTQKPDFAEMLAPVHF